MKEALGGRSVLAGLRCIFETRVMGLQVSVFRDWEGVQMPTVTVETATVRWDAKKKMWGISIQIGEEVIRRFESMPWDAGDKALRILAVTTVRDDGYEIAPEEVRIQREQP
jgi:hypothetical protein